MESSADCTGQYSDESGCGISLLRERSVSGVESHDRYCGSGSSGSCSGSRMLQIGRENTPPLAFFDRREPVFCYAGGGGDKMLLKLAAVSIERFD